MKHASRGVGCVIVLVDDDGSGGASGVPWAVLMEAA